MSDSDLDDEYPIMSESDSDDESPVPDSRPAPPTKAPVDDKGTTSSRGGSSSARGGFRGIRPSRGRGSGGGSRRLQNNQVQIVSKKKMFLNACKG
jgi:hypothetical protein